MAMVMTKPWVVGAGAAVGVMGAVALLLVGTNGNLPDAWIVTGLVAGVVGMFGSAWIFGRAGLPVLLTLAAVSAELGVGLLWLGPWGLIYLAVAVGLVVAWAVRDRRRRAWEAVGQPAIGVVVTSRRTGSVINNQDVVTKVSVSVRPTNGDPEFTTTVRRVVPMGLDDSPGDELPMLVDPRRPGRAVIDRRPRTATTSTPARQRDDTEPSETFLNTLALGIAVDDDEMVGMTRVEHADRMTEQQFAAALVPVPGWDSRFVAELYRYCHRRPTLAMTIWNITGALRSGVISRADFDLTIRVEITHPAD